MEATHDPGQWSVAQLHWQIEQLYAGCTGYLNSLGLDYSSGHLEMEFLDLWKRMYCIELIYDHAGFVHFRRAHLEVVKISGQALLIVEQSHFPHASYHDAAFQLAASFLAEIEDKMGAHDRTAYERVVPDEPQIDFSSPEREGICSEWRDTFNQTPDYFAQLVLEFAAVDPDIAGEVEGEQSTVGVNKRFKPGPCPSCGSENTKVKSTQKMIRFLKCKECQHNWKLSRRS